ncbi:MAG TPA: PAS domain S-box protein [Stellaceae bacterium]|nr:PAS domain S-box protein [Stellaceae bacterium]
MSVTWLRQENENLLDRLREAEETVHAIREGAVDAFVVEDEAGRSQVYTLEGADHPYRILIERTQQGTAVLHGDGTIAYSNLSLAELLQVPHERLTGACLGDFIPPPAQAAYLSLLGQARHGKSRGEIDLRRSDGVRVPVAVDFSLLSRGDGMIGALVTDLTDRRQYAELAAANRALRESEARLRHILDSATEYAIISLDPHRRVTSWNSGAERLLGYSQAEILGCSGDIFFTPGDRVAGQPEREMRRAREEGRAANERWHLRKDGSRFWGSGVMLPIDEEGEAGYLKIFRDRTAEKQAEERQSLLVNELNHRVKNTLATVQSIAAQSLRAESGGGLEGFESRLVALSHAHDLLTRSNWQGVPLRELLLQELEPYRSDGCTRLRVEGPDLRLAPKAAIALTMAFHELATNAAKYGALAEPAGEVHVTWNVEGDITDAAPQMLRLQWAETGGPPIAPPVRKGFGLRLIERGLSLELDGEVRLAFEPPGLVCTIAMPLSGGKGSSDVL